MEITEQGLKALKIETAISGGSQKDILEHLILQGISSRTQAALGDVPQVTKTTQLPFVESTPPMECKKEGEAIICTPRTLTQEARTALEFILSEMKEGREPTTGQVSDVVRMKQTGISRILGKLGVYSQNTRRDMKSVRIYPLTVQPKIEALLAGK